MKNRKSITWKIGTRAIGPVVLPVGLLLVLFLQGEREGLQSREKAAYDHPVLIVFPRPDRLKHGEFLTAQELEVWARNRNLRLQLDCPNGALQNYIAEAIPSQGLEFTLAAPGRSRVFLYLDLVAFRPAQDNTLRVEGECEAGSDLIRYPGKMKGLLSRVQWLEVIVNGKVLKTLYQGGGVFIRSPVEVIVNREDMMDRILRIRLLPSPGSGFFAIWDVFASRRPLRP